MSQPYFMRALLLALGTASWLLFLCSGAQANIIDTNYDGEPTTSDSPLRIEDIAAVGQTFSVVLNTSSINDDQKHTLPTKNVLERFSFWVDAIASDGAVVNFTASIREWDGVKATGEVLYQSPVKTKAANSGFEQVSFYPDGLTLQPGKQYVAYVSIDSSTDSNAKIAIKGSPLSNPYKEGRRVSSSGNLTSHMWRRYGNDDAAFIASFVLPPADAPAIPMALSAAAAVAAATGGGSSDANQTQIIPEQGLPQPPSPESIPTPALLPGLVGLGWGVLRKTKPEEASSTADDNGN